MSMLHEYNDTTITTITEQEIEVILKVNKKVNT